MSANDDIPFLVCTRIADGPAIADVIGKCAACGAAISMTIASLKAVGEPHRTICLQCAARLVTTDTTIMPMTKDQAAEIRDNMNHEDR